MSERLTYCALSRGANEWLESRSHRVTESRSRRVTESQSHRVAESQSRRVTESQSHRVAESQSRRVTGSLLQLGAAAPCTLAHQNIGHMSMQQMGEGTSTPGSPGRWCLCTCICTCTCSRWEMAHPRRRRLSAELVRRSTSSPASHARVTCDQHELTSAQRCPREHPSIVASLVLLAGWPPLSLHWLPVSSGPCRSCSTLWSLHGWAYCVGVVAGVRHTCSPSWGPTVVCPSPDPTFAGARGAKAGWRSASLKTRVATRMVRAACMSEKAIALHS